MTWARPRRRLGSTFELSSVDGEWSALCSELGNGPSLHRDRWSVICAVTLPAVAIWFALICVVAFVVWLWVPDLSPDERVGRFVLRHLPLANSGVCVVVWTGGLACRAGATDIQPLPLGILIQVLAFVGAGFLIGALHRVRPSSYVARAFVGSFALFSALWGVAVLHVYGR